MPQQQRNVFRVASVASAQASGSAGPFSLGSYRVVIEPVSGPAASTSRRIVWLVRPEQMGNSFAEFSAWAAAKLARDHFFRNVEIEPLPEALQADFPRWQQRIIWLPKPKVTREKTAPASTAQSAGGVEPDRNYVDDAGGAKRGYAFGDPAKSAAYVAAGLNPDGTRKVEFSRSGIMNRKAIANLETSLMLKGYSYTAAASLAAEIAANPEAAANFADATDDLADIRRRLDALEADNRKMEGEVSKLYAGNQSIPEERRAFLLGQSQLGKRVLRSRAEDRRYQRARQEMKDDVTSLASGRALIREGSEATRALYDPPAPGKRMSDGGCP